jgi:hypothetical protein
MNIQVRVAVASSDNACRCEQVLIIVNVHVIIVCRRRSLKDFAFSFLLSPRGEGSAVLGRDGTEQNDSEGSLGLARRRT